MPDCSNCPYIRYYSQASEYFGAIVYEQIEECSRGETPGNCIMTRKGDYEEGTETREG
jgi:hypothetical protein